MNATHTNRARQVLSLLLLLSTIFIADISSAATNESMSSSKWQISPTESTITFTAIQNGAPVSGQFKTFTGDIKFDPTQLRTSAIRIVVDMNSVFTSYGQIADTLKTSDWFDVKAFPQAIFTSNQFTKTGDKSYQINGMLTIRDKTVPITINFILDDYSKTHASAHGTTTLKRTTFNVGQGDWAMTTIVKDDVDVKFTIAATAK